MSDHQTLDPQTAATWDALLKPQAMTPPAPPPKPPATPPAATGPAKDLDYTKPWADHVDGIPTGQTARPDDGPLSTETKTKDPTKVTSDKKKYGTAGAANHTVEKGTTTVVKEGDVTDTKVAKGTVKGNWQNKAVSAGGSVSKEHKVGEGADAMSLTKTKSGSVDADKTGATATMGKSQVTKMGQGSQESTSSAATAGYKNGHVVVDLGKTTSREHNGVGNETKKTVGLNEGEVTGGLTKTKSRVVGQEVVNGVPVDKKESTATAVKAGVGKDSASASATRTYTNGNGTSNAVTAGAKINYDGTGSANAGYTRGDKDGNAVTVSAKAGISVTTEEIKEENGRFVVAYKRTKSVGGGAGASHKGVGANVSGQHDSYDMGTRSFATQAEAEDFKKNAAKRVRAEAPDPRTLAGAMAMEVGETLGHGTSDSGTIGGSATVQGATGSIAKTKSSTDEKTVRRVSANVFEVTATHSGTDGVSGGLKGNGIGLTKSKSETAGNSVTYRFDLATPEGQVAFQQYQTLGIVPTGKGGKQVSETESKAEDVKSGVSVFGLLSDTHTQESWESTTRDEKGKHEEYGGKKSHTVSTGWIGRNIFGDKNTHQSVSLLSKQENDKASAYRVEAHFGGEDGSHNRKGIRDLVSDFYDDKRASAKASGDWTLTADIDPAAMARWLQIVERKGIKDPDAQMRYLSELTKEHGFAACGMEYGGDTKLAWNVELKGDKNFPGEKGRAEHDAKVKAYTELMKISMASPESLVKNIQGEIADLEARKAAVADPKRYTDLPDKVRMQQLSLIDEQIAQFKAVRHPGLVEMSKNNLGENPDFVGNRVNDPKGYDNLPPEQRELAKLRDQITMDDQMLATYEKENMEKRRAMSFAVDNYTDEEKAKKAGARNRRELREQLDLGRSLDDVHRRSSIGKVDDLRGQFLAAMNDPKQAMILGRQLRDALKRELDDCRTAADALHQASQMQAKLNTAKATSGKFKTYWTQMNEENKENNYELPVYADPYARTGMTMTLPE